MVRGSFHWNTVWIRRRGHACMAALAAIVVIVAGVVLSMPRITWACGGPPPPPPAFCNYSYSFAKAVPRVIVCPAGGGAIVPITTFHFINVFGNACPPPPYSVTMSVTLSCVPPPSAGPVVFGPFAVGQGFTIIPIALAIPCSPPRICTLSVVSTVVFGGGKTLTLTGDVEVCIVEEVPGQPGVPRLDLQLLSPVPAAAGTHAGDQATATYRITNNDPVESWTGTLGAEFHNTARQPTELPLGPIREASGLADPGPGDNWPIDFDFNLPPGGCIPLPPDPQNQLVSTASAPAFTLDPGESRDFSVLARPWGMCANGSCGESNVKADGDFTDLTDGIACASTTYYVDNSIPPTFAWPDGGSVPLVTPFPGQPVMAFDHRPSFFDVFTFQAQMQGPVVTQFPRPPQSAFTQAGQQDLGQWRGRFGSQLGPPLGGGNWAVDSFFDITYRIDFFGPGSEPFTGLTMMVVPGAPFGFESLAPLAMGTGDVDSNGDLAVDSFFDIFYQVNGVAQTDIGPVPIEIVSLNLVSANPSFLDVEIQALVPSTSGATQVFGFELMTDMGGYSRPLNIPVGACCFGCSNGAPNPPCPNPTGPTVPCLIGTAAACASAGGIYAGDNTTCVCCLCPGDVNGDGLTNVSDFNIVAGNFGGGVPNCKTRGQGDLNCDGIVNIADFNIMAGNFGCARPVTCN